MMKRRTHILIAEPSIIICSGVVSVLKKMNNLNIDFAEIHQIEKLIESIDQNSPDIVIINPSYLGIFSPQQFKRNDIKIIALQYTLSDSSTLKHYDDVISIYDSSSVINEKITNLIESTESSEDKKELSVREKEIISYIAKGFSNKAIADKLYLSTHTVTTHRRNIATKLQIHSPAGLTIYAIVNKIIDINDIKHSLTSID